MQTNIQTFLIFIVDDVNGGTKGSKPITGA